MSLVPPRVQTGALDRALRALDEGSMCKIICGIGSRKAKRIRNLSAIYAAAGAHVIDMAAHIDVMEAVQAGIAWAERHHGARRPLLMVSMGMGQDPHVGVPLLDTSVCSTCSHCWCTVEKWCAGRPLESRHLECPSCMACMRACPFDAISVVQPGLGNPALLMEMIRRGAQAVELHISGSPKKEFMGLWRAVAPMLTPDTLVSFSVGSSVTDEALLREHLDIVHALGHPRIVFQAEGHPMSGDRDGTDRAAASLALVEQVRAHGAPRHVQASGGCDGATGALARDQGVDLSGIGFGSHARALINEVLVLDRLDLDSPTVQSAIARAAALVQSVRP